ncbi:dormancy-associated protein 2 isoform X2 [Diachasma alloeum]|uniref:dormancy-associated protein 2 isoform X2 n=1 Tax=Diachasma alloeum TaxID=454923 RepID=UPI0007381FCA|nr:dormancy-associated protein 2 isoform X2 [Diachasma alloeum]
MRPTSMSTSVFHRSRQECNSGETNYKRFNDMVKWYLVVILATIVVGALASSEQQVNEDQMLSRMIRSADPLADPHHRRRGYHGGGHGYYRGGGYYKGGGYYGGRHGYYG